MEALFQYLQSNPFLLLFVTVGLAVWIGRFSVKGYGLGMVVAAVVVGVALATWASVYGVKLQLVAGSQTMSAAIGTAEMAVTQGAYKVPAGATAEWVSAMIALGYGISYIWSTGRPKVYHGFRRPVRAFSTTDAPEAGILSSDEYYRR